MAASHPLSTPLARHAIGELELARQRLNRSTSNLTEALSCYAPAEGMMTAAQQVAHAARVIDWFFEGAFRREGFDMNFDDQIKLVLTVESLTAARAWFDKSVSNAIEILAVQSDASLTTPLPAGQMMGGMPRIAIINAITDHTAHHRGALTVYARMKQIVPPDPYET